uniref:Uncharacterized protein n=1 Tax=virus sp. ctE0n6 TaxID=2827985 RepID=A0A8S5RFX6_9VIRU|nr:MAG TPA: hypothetical protein [virus sp. ctE0n6]
MFYIKEFNCLVFGYNITIYIILIFGGNIIGHRVFRFRVF